ncbi:MAG: hypothetical protein IJE01_06695 [Clostridia bacterium]|nr:hypothetical protein [Clostridia bacterium]
MTISEKVAYIKGLAEGLGLDSEDKNSKVLKAIIDLLEDVALTVEDLEDGCAELCEQIDAVDEDLSNLEDFIYEEDEDDEYFDEDEFFDDDDELYEVECPACHDIVYLDEGMLEEGEIACPNCGTNLEFDFDECDCDCCDGECEDKE